jgi:pimeloyl-ACP methyl ester carboxylesterase
MPSRASAIVAATAATLGAMTAYNVYRARKVEREHPPTGRFVTVNGVRLHYLERGEGPPVVLLHGKVVTPEEFQTSGVVDLLARQHRVIAFDRPGFGIVIGRRVQLGVYARRLTFLEMRLMCLVSTVLLFLVIPGAQRWPWHWR